MLFSEAVFRLSMFGAVNFNIWIALFSLAYGVFLAFICSSLKEKWGKIAAFILSFISFLFFGTNIVYQHIFSTILSVTQIGMGPAAIKNFYRETLIGIKECSLYLGLILIPIIVLIVAVGKGFPKKRLKPWACFVALLSAVLIYVGTVYGINMQPDSNYGVKELYHNDFVLSLSENQFGALTTTRLEIKNIIFGKGVPSISVEEEEEEEEEHSRFYDHDIYNVMDIDFAKLAKSAEDPRHKELDEYFEGKLPTKKNEYTGKYKGYNVITILCESLSEYIIDEQRTPALYKLANEGISFTDYYSANDNNTNNSEYCFLTSLMPDETLFAPVGEAFDRFREYNSCTASKSNYLPFTLGNQFNSRGIRSIFYHNYLSSYYNRDLTHGNFGYELCTMKDGLKYSPYWPTSDIDLMTQSLRKLLAQNEYGHVPPFHAYFLTFSGHMAYNFETNQMAISHKEEIESLTQGKEYSEAALAYMSCNMELEKGIEILLKELEKAGVLDNTLIVLAPDHYPYGLGLGGLSEIAGKSLLKNKDIAEINRHKGCLLMWTPSMAEEEKVVIDYPVSELDVLPTLLNLLGYNYDSRLLMGTDAFSDSRHFAAFDNRSFVTKDFYFIVSSGNMINRTETEITENNLAYYQTLVKNKFTVSNDILYSDYYRHVFEK